MFCDKSDADRVGDPVHHATRYGNDNHLNEMADNLLTWQKADVREQLIVFASFQRAVQERGGKLPEQFYPWAEGLARELVRHPDAGRVNEGVQLAHLEKRDFSFRTLDEQTTVWC